MLRKQRTRGTKADLTTKSYRSEYIRRRTLQKSFKGTEKGYKPLERLAETMHTGMEVLWRQHCMCDIELVAADRKHFKAHRVVLATCCDYFYDLLALSDTEVGYQVEVGDVRGNILDLLIEAMYTGRVKVEAANVDDILIAADNLGMYIVMDACEAFLLEHVSKENCLPILATSFKYSMSRLIEHTLQVAAQNFMTVSKTPHFRNLPVEHLISLLKRDDLNVNSELDTFNRAKIWIEETRQRCVEHAADVLETIRLPLLTPSDIIDNVERSAPFMDAHGCQRLVKEALHYHLMPSRQCLLQSPRTVPRKKGDVCLVVVGGAPRLASEPVNDKVIKYDQKANKWEPVAVLPEPRHHHAVAVLNGFLYVAGGDVAHQSNTPVNTVHRYNPRNGSWMQVASMINCRQSFQLCALNSTVYAVGGRVSNDELLSAVEKYDPSLDRWEEVASLSSPRRCVAVGCLGGKLYAVGGSNVKTISSRAERYSPMENRWELIRPTNAPRFFGHLQTVTNFLYLLGGAGIDNKGSVVCIDTIERYSYSANQWTVISFMRTPRSESGSTVIKEKIYLIGGYNWNKSERITEVECFDTETNCWSMLPKLDQPLTGVAANSIQLYDIPTRQNDLTNNCCSSKTAKSENTSVPPGKSAQLDRKQAKSNIQQNRPDNKDKTNCGYKKSISDKPSGSSDDTQVMSQMLPENDKALSDNNIVVLENELLDTMRISADAEPNGQETENNTPRKLVVAAENKQDGKDVTLSTLKEEDELVELESSSASNASSMQCLVHESVGYQDLSNNCVEQNREKFENDCYRTNNINNCVEQNREKFENDCYRTNNINNCCLEVRHNSHLNCCEHTLTWSKEAELRNDCTKTLNEQCNGTKCRNDDSESHSVNMKRFPKAADGSQACVITDVSCSKNVVGDKN